ncbi:619_t:CDS:2, partial [Racocetra persica]
VAKRNMLVQNEQRPDEVNFAPAATLIRLIERYRTISQYWERIDQAQRRRLLEQAEDQLGIKSTNDLFEKIEKLYKDKHSTADTPLLQIHLCITPSVALQWKLQRSGSTQSP